MSSSIIITALVSYFSMLMIISFFTNRNAGNNTFFIGDRKSPWYLVAFGMIGTSISGVTFISVPGWVGTSQFSYLQMVIGYLAGYFIIATVLMPLYYRLKLVSIYTYLESRFGFWSYKTGAFYFLLSRTIGSAFRLYLAANVLQMAIFDKWGIPFYLTVTITLGLIWLYTFQGGVKTIVWTDTFQTIFLLGGALGTALFITHHIGWNVSDTFVNINESEYSKIFFWDWADKHFFIKQFLSGAFIAIVMTGLDQDMMQKNLSCRNIKEAQWNMFSFSGVLILVNMLFLTLGAMLYIFAQQKNIIIPVNSDDLFPVIALNHLPIAVGILFIIGLIAATFASSDSALTALTTSFCFDFLNVNSKTEAEVKNARFKVHILFSIILIISILIFKEVNDDSVISAIFKAAGFTYGPLLGLYAFGLFTKLNVDDKFVPIVCILSPIFCLIINKYSKSLLYGYEFGYEILILNGLLTFFGLYLLKIEKTS